MKCEHSWRRKRGLCGRLAYLIPHEMAEDIPSFP
jgi:hypothetical protein